MSQMRNREAPAYVVVIIGLMALMVGAPCWAAVGLEDLAGPLRALAQSVGQPGAAPQLGPLARPTPSGEVLVTVEFRSEMAAAARSLTPFGARTRFRHSNLVEAFVPARELLNIAGLPEVSQVRLPNYAYPMQGFGASRSEGVQFVGALPFHTAGIIGQNVTVAIIDVGFNGYAAAEIPIDPAATVSFRVDATMGSNYHGTAVAEIAADMAPGADFVLIAVDTELSVQSAIDYVINSGIDIVCMSMGLFGGPYDGSHAVSRAVNRARAAGVFWVSASGNQAQRHYQGAWRDLNRNRFHEFSMGDESIDVMLEPGQYTAYLSWYETAGAMTNRDYDLVLYDATDTEVARSGFTQNGDDPPVDVLTAFISTAGQYRLHIEYVSGPTEQQDMFQLFSPGVDLEAAHQVPESSLVIPAEATGSYTVGATRGALVTDPAVPMVAIDELEPFSSQGPVVSHPEIIKPDLSGPDGVTTSLATQGFSPFIGTSAAAPHVAGAAALLLSEDQLRTPKELAIALQTQALRLGDPVPNNRFGWGRLRLRMGADSRPPTITISYPQNGVTITTRTPTIIAFIADDGSGVDPSSITVQLDGLTVFDGATVTDTTEYFDPDTGQFRWSMDDALARTNHTVVIGATDNAGNEASPAVTNFRVAAPTMPAGISMVSFPYKNLQVTDPSAILGVPPADLGLVRWWPLDEAYDKYHYYPDARAALIPPDCQYTNLDDRTVPYPPAGLGYFLSIPRQAVLDIQGEPLSDVPSTHIRLYRGQQAPRGWNLIGNPYDEPVSWGSVQFVTGGVRQDLRDAIAAGVTEGVLFEYRQGVGGAAGFYDFAPNPTTAMMEPRKGYWLHVNRDTRVVIYGAGVGGAGIEPTVTASTDEGWLMTLSARAGDLQDPRNVIGMQPTATAGYDPQWDLPEPPPITDGLRVCMVRSGWGDHSGRYARDVRGPGDTLSWDVEVACSVGTTEVELTWPDLNTEVPKDVRLMLEDLDNGQTVYMRTSTNYRFRTGADGGTRHLRITAVGEGGALALQSMAAAPTAGGAMITYALSGPAEVSVEVLNIAGRPVKRFSAQAVEGGTQQTVAWNGVSDRGSAVPSGRYLVRLTARAADGQTVQAIRPFSLAR